MASGGKRKGAGAKRKPHELKVLEGRFRAGHDPVPPPVIGGFPAMPDDLSEAEQRVWAGFVRAPWIGESDRDAVRAAVCLFARLMQNQREQRALAPEYPQSLIAQELQLWSRLLSVLSSLGLTPSDRGKMTVPTLEEAVDKWAGVLS